MLLKTWSVHETFLIATWALTNVWHVYPPVLRYPVTAWQAVFSYEIVRLFCTARGSSSSTSRTLGRTQFVFEICFIFMLHVIKSVNVSGPCKPWDYGKWLWHRFFRCDAAAATNPKIAVTRLIVSLAPLFPPLVNLWNDENCTGDVLLLDICKKEVVINTDDCQLASQFSKQLTWE